MPAHERVVLNLPARNQQQRGALARRLPRWAGPLGVLALLGGCYGPDLGGEGFFRCSDGRCPDGFACSPAKECVPEGTEQPACSASESQLIATDLTTSIGLALDRMERRLYISFAGGGDPPSVSVASREVPDGGWETRPYSRRAVSGTQGFTAIDAHDGRVAVVFDDTLSPGGGGGSAGADARAVRLATAPEQQGALLDLPYGRGSGAFVAVRHLLNQPTMLVAYRSDDRTQVALVNHELRTVIGHPVEIGVPPDGPQLAGQFNRLAIFETSPGTMRAHVAFLAASDDSGFESSQAYLARQEQPQQFERAQPLGELSVRLPAAARGLDIAADDGLHVVWTEKTGNDHQVQYQPPEGAPQLVRPGGELPSSAGAPALAAHGGLLGLAYIDSDGVLWLTTRRHGAPDAPWLPAQPLQDTRESGALQVKLAILEASDATVVFELAYVNNSRHLRYWRVTCAL